MFIKGTNARDNWRILEEADPSDIWVHNYENPSAYVIIKTRELLNTAPTLDDIRHAGIICTRSSKQVNERKNKICYLEVKYVHKGKTPGQAILLRTPNVKVLKKNVDY
jgi:predicted ribosome quality control (RQC) complex YloA/Tae2 family protein